MIPGWLEPVRAATETITAGDLTRFAPGPDHSGRQGAVLVLFGDIDQGPEVLLTERSHVMRSQPGHVSFPGGGIDPGETPVQAALREAKEETGLDPTGVEVFGSLPRLLLPPADYAVAPVLGWWRTPSPVGVVDPGEVHEVYRVPVDYLLDAANRVTVRHPAGAYRSPGFLIGDGVVLWGFTAGILSRLFDYVGWTRPWDAGRTVAVPPHHLVGRPPSRQAQALLRDANARTADPE